MKVFFSLDGCHISIVRSWDNGPLGTDRYKPPPTFMPPTKEQETKTERDTKQGCLSSFFVSFSNILQRPVLQSVFNIPRVSFCYLASLDLTKAIQLSGPTTLVINSISQPRVSQYERVHMKEAAFAAYDQPQTRTSLPAAERHILQTKSKL